MNYSTSPQVAVSSPHNNDSLHCIQASATRFRSLGVALAVAVLCSIVLLPLTSSAQTATGATWDNTGTEWTSGASWVGDNAPTNNNGLVGNIATFSNAAPGFNTVNLCSGRGIYGLVFVSGANAYTFTGSALTVGSGGGISNASASLQTFSNKVINNGGGPVYGSYAGGSLLFAGGIDITTPTSDANRTLTLGGSGDITVSGSIASGASVTNTTGGNVSVTNTALTIFSGNNTYLGTTTVSSGARLRLGSATALGATNSGTTISSGGALDLNGQTIGAEGLTLSGTGVSSSGAIFNSSASAATWSGNITPSDNSTIKATNGSITLSGGIDLNDNAASSRTLTLEGAGGILVSGNISNSSAGSTGNITIAGTSGVFTFSGSNSYTGLTTLTNQSTIRIASVDALSRNSSLSGASASARTGTLDLAAGNYTMNSYVSGNFNLLATNGASSLTFTNTGTGNLVGVGSRTITATNVAVTFDGSVDISPTTAAKTFTVAGNSDFTFNGSIITTNTTNAAGLVVESTGRTTLNASNNYDGATTVSAGATLRLANSYAMGATNGLTNTVASGGALELLGGITVNGEILALNGTGVSDGGALRNISGDNTYNGLIRITGTNRINSDAGTLTVSGFSRGLASDRSLIVGGAGNTEIAGALNGTGTGRLVKDGTGTLTISAANTVDGGTTVGAGTLVVSSSGSITASANNSVIISNGASLRYNGSTALFAGSVDLGAGGGPGRAVLGGTGTINSAVTLDSVNDVLSPGDSPGIQNFTPAQTWSSFTYDWELNNFIGTVAGDDFDKIVIAGALDLSATTANSYGLNILSLTAGNVSGVVPNFAEANTTWTILSAGGLTGFDAAEWTINASGFTTGTAYLGSFSLAQVGNDLQLTYTVPEPSTYALLGVSALTFGAWFIRRRRKP